MYVCFCIGVSVCECRCVKRPEEGDAFPGAKVTSDYELHSVGTGN